MSAQSRSFSFSFSFSSALYNYRRSRFHTNTCRRTTLNPVYCNPNKIASVSSSQVGLLVLHNKKNHKYHHHIYQKLPSWKNYHYHQNSSSHPYSSLATETRHPISYDSHSTINSSTSTPLSSSSSSNQNNNNHKIKPFLLTDIGEGITEVELIQWYIQPNQKINQFDNVCQVQSDKATVDITSRYDGIVHSLNGCDVGDMIQVGQPLMFVRVDDDEDDVDDNDNDDDDSFSSRSSCDSSSGGDRTGPTTDERSVTTRTTTSGTNTTSSIPSTFQKRNNDTITSSSSKSKSEKFLATPAVRKLIRENNIDVSSLQGTGPNARILKGDVLNFLGLVQNHDEVVVDDRNQEDTKIETVQERQEHFSSSSSSSDSSTEENEVIPIRGYHRLMVNSMTTTLQVPHMTYSDEVEMTNLMKMRNEFNEMLQEQENKDHQGQKPKPRAKVSFLPFMIKACSLAIKEHPVLNSSINEEKMTLTYHKRHDIGIAMDSDRGLVVPVVRGCEHLSIFDIASELDELRTSVRFLFF